MNQNDPPTAATTEIRLNEALALQRAAYRRQPVPSLAERQEDLKKRGVI